MLNDNNIRVRLIDFLTAKRPAPLSIIEELHIENGRAIADVVAIHNNLHCYEIKGESDSIKRIKTQANFYNKSFSKVTLVTTKNHLSWAKKNSPSFWGILLVEHTSNDSISFKYIRKTNNNPYFSKEISLMMLWKEELINIASDIKIKTRSSYTRSELANLISCSLSKEKILEVIRITILTRKSLRKAI
ncbi:MULTISPECIES: sce7726 family protein [Erwiniaceae]|uniref:sce7726 family protein n=1 Tax=Erwiniaceae TaxID=1903409 RepID=UPI003015FCC4